MYAPKQFDSSRSGPFADEVLGVLNGSGRVVFFQIGAIHGMLQALAPRVDGPDGNLQAANLNSAAWAIRECALPASRFETPRPHENAALHHYRPYADEAMRLTAGPDADHLSIANGGQ